MRDDAISKILLALIALFLGLLALRPLVTPAPSAAAKPVRYRIIEDTGRPLRPEFRELESLLNRVGSEGWDLVTLVRGGVILKQSE